ncbi:hypothetical protein FQA39_LY14915 [Lamprigera yunnana]|nr:hypothetical protein FQA39_LY14915 [Lamprigera yunnana]
MCNPRITKQEEIRVQAAGFGDNKASQSESLAKTDYLIIGLIIIAVTQRREDEEIVKRKLNELNKYKEHFNNIKTEVANKIQNKEIKSDQSGLINNLLKRVLLKLNKIDTFIQKRLQNLDASVHPLNLESSSAQNSENIFDHNTETKMSENFDFKTAASLLPKVDNDLNTVYQLIEGIELYEHSLSAVGKPLLFNYQFLPKQSSTALLVQLQQTKQGNLNIDEYGRPIESLMADLTIAQAGDNGEAIATLREANEKIASDVFTRGIRNREVLTVA